PVLPHLRPTDRHLRRLAALALALWFIPSVALAGPLPSVNPASLVQWDCLDLRISLCVCGSPPKPCLRVKYWEPTLLVNTEAFTGLNRTGTGSRFHEARVWPFPLKPLLGVFSFPCSSGFLKSLSAFTMLPYYLSDTDPLWRTGDLQTMGGLGALSNLSALMEALKHPRTLSGSLKDAAQRLGPIGTWGTLYPRSGWGVGGSDPVTSALICYRAIDVAANASPAHVVLRPSGVPASTSDKINLGFPKVSRCLRPGTPHLTWEHGTGSPIGQYLWVYWTPKSCCVKPSRFFFGGIPVGIPGPPSLPSLVALPGIPGLPAVSELSGLLGIPGLPMRGLP
ncbi:MAG: TraU family protein, partial [Anaerolineae bacterium]